MALPTDPRRALVLFSGGQDSTACLAWALGRYASVETIGFDYGQRHAVELACRDEVRRALLTGFPHWAPRLGADHRIDMALLGQISDTALTAERAIEMNAEGLPNTFVPGRNLLFFNFAAAVAYRRGASVLVGGMCETDFSGYPDCRDNTLKALQVAISLGLATPMTIEAPLMWLDKAATWALAEQLGGRPLVELTIEHTHTCYLGDRRLRHPWGYGCGLCPACDLRRRGWQEWRRGEDRQRHAGAGGRGVDHRTVGGTPGDSRAERPGVGVRRIGDSGTGSIAIGDRRADDSGLDDSGLDHGGLDHGGLDDSRLDDGGLDDSRLGDGGISHTERDDSGLHHGGLDHGGLHDSRLDHGGLDDSRLDDSRLGNGGPDRRRLDQGRPQDGRPDRSQGRSGVDDGEATTVPMRSPPA